MVLIITLLLNPFMVPGGGDIIINTTIIQISTPLITTVVVSIGIVFQEDILSRLLK
ncbi:hypothetical protein HOLleu_24091 [Holothuria leucospilota]|uniref:Uncharacterized protein n=1 Tax=Holothuria leucospilota TaxID=206669 RepID=A0A9Q1BVX1_HOLLE|nr:hypothetical protein HOLleu_24091 [Holothuria leucospilota]